MKSIIKCYRCGKDYDLKYKDVKEVISCSHCHQKMRFDAKTKRHFKIVRYLVVLIVCLGMAYGMSLVSQNNYVMLLVSVAAGVVFAGYSDQACTRIVDRTFGISYEEYHPQTVSRKQQRKADSKKKKGLFK